MSGPLYFTFVSRITSWFRSTRQIPVRRLKCSFHRYIFLLFFCLIRKSEGKGSFFFHNMQIASLFLSKVLSICVIALLLQNEMIHY